MKLNDCNIILETLSETKDVCFGTEIWDQGPGGESCGMYAAYFHLRLPEPLKHDYVIDFASESIKKYWEDLCKAHRNDYHRFDFDLGEEINNSYSKHNHRDVRNVNLRAAEHISNIGINNFNIEKCDGDDYQGLKVTSLKGQSFVFKDTEDLRMYDSIEDVFNKKKLTLESTSREKELNEFIGN